MQQGRKQTQKRWEYKERGAEAGAWSHRAAGDAEGEAGRNRRRAQGQEGCAGANNFSYDLGSSSLLLDRVIFTSLL